MWLTWRSALAAGIWLTLYWLTKDNLDRHCTRALGLPRVDRRERLFRRRRICACCVRSGSRRTRGRRRLVDRPSRRVAVAAALVVVGVDATRNHGRFAVARFHRRAVGAARTRADPRRREGR